MVVAAAAAVVVEAVVMAVEREETVHSRRMPAQISDALCNQPTLRYQPLELATAPVAHHFGQRLYINDEQTVAPALVKRLTGYTRVGRMAVNCADYTQLAADVDAAW